MRYWLRLKDQAAIKAAYGVQPSDWWLALGGNYQQTYLADLYNRLRFVISDTELQCHHDPPLRFEEWQEDHADKVQQVEDIVQEAIIGVDSITMSEEDQYEDFREADVGPSYEKAGYEDAVGSPPLSAALSTVATPFSPNFGVLVR